MITIANRSNKLPHFEQLLPAIRRQAERAFRYQSVDVREELAAETIAMAFHAYCRLVERGKQDLAYATPLAQFSIRQVRDGRTLGNQRNVRDISSKIAQRTKGFRVLRLNMRQESTDDWQQMVVEDKTAGPADIAATRIDFAAWLKTLQSKRQRIAKTLATGETTSRVAREFNLSSARISQLRRELQQAWRDFQGELVLL